MNSLTKLYRHGQIGYPRVFNGYSNVKSSHFPHKPLYELNSLLEPLEKANYPLTLDTSSLYLCNYGLNEFSRISSINKYLTSNFTHELKPKKSKEVKIKTLQDKLSLFLMEENINKDESSYYDDTHYLKREIFGIKHSTPSLLMQKNTPIRVSSDINQTDDICFQPFTSIDEAIDGYRSWKIPILKKTPSLETEISLKSDDNQQENEFSPKNNNLGM